MNESAETNYSSIKLIFEFKPLGSIPYNDKTKAIGFCDGVWYQGKLYRIQGIGAETNDGEKVKILGLSTPEFFNETAGTQRKLHPDFLVRDLDMILSELNLPR